MLPDFVPSNWVARLQWRLFRSVTSRIGGRQPNWRDNLHDLRYSFLSLKNRGMLRKFFRFHWQDYKAWRAPIRIGPL